MAAFEDGNGLKFSVNLPGPLIIAKAVAGNEVAIADAVPGAGGGAGGKPHAPAGTFFFRADVRPMRCGRCLSKDTGSPCRKFRFSDRGRGHAASNDTSSAWCPASTPGDAAWRSSAYVEQLEAGSGRNTRPSISRSWRQFEASRLKPKWSSTGSRNYPRDQAILPGGGIVSARMT